MLGDVSLWGLWGKVFQAPRPSEMTDNQVVGAAMFARSVDDLRILREQRESAKPSKRSK